MEDQQASAGGFGLKDRPGRSSQSNEWRPHLGTPNELQAARSIPAAGRGHQRPNATSFTQSAASPPEIGGYNGRDVYEIGSDREVQHMQGTAGPRSLIAPTFNPNRKQDRFREVRRTPEAPGHRVQERHSNYSNSGSGPHNVAWNSQGHESDSMEYGRNSESPWPFPGTSDYGQARWDARNYFEYSRFRKPPRSMTDPPEGLIYGGKDARPVISGHDVPSYNINHGLIDGPSFHYRQEISPLEAPQQPPRAQGGHGSVGDVLDYYYTEATVDPYSSTSDGIPSTHFYQANGHQTPVVAQTANYRNYGLEGASVITNRMAGMRIGAYPFEPNHTAAPVELAGETSHHRSASPSAGPSTTRLASTPAAATSSSSLAHSQTIGLEDDSLPQHPTPDSSRRVSAADSLPEHPAPVRLGLQQDRSLSVPGQATPRRQNSPVNSTRSSMEPRVNQSEQSYLGPVTHTELDQLQQHMKANPSDVKTLLHLAKRLIEASSILASEGGRADSKTTRRNRENYILEAHRILKKITGSAHPYPEAMFYLATCYGGGTLGLQIDHEKAFSLYQSAAKLNHAGSAYRTAVCCEIGAGTKKDPLKAIQWYKKSASLGDTAAMYKLGMILLKGLLGQPRSVRDAISWLKRAADQADGENPHALHELALLYERADSGSDSIIRDEHYSGELFTKAAELGYPPSQFRLGCAYEYGTMGCEIDARKSIFWYSKAAMQGEPESELALSGWYLTGSDEILQQSDTEAYLWARKSAEKGLSKAEFALGYFSEVGIGVRADLEDAKRWYYKAASQNHPKAQQRLAELKKGATSMSRPRERLSRSNKTKDDQDCVIM